MHSALGCPVCGDDDCVRHRAVLIASSLLQACVTGLGMLAAGLWVGRRRRLRDKGKRP